MPYLCVEHLKKSFVTPSGREVLALTDISFGIERGQILSVVGHNGSGKTTLLNCLRGGLPWDRGRILIDEADLDHKQVKIVSVFQDVGLGVVGSMTPLENLSLVFSHEPGFLLSFPRRRFKSRILDFLDASGLRSRLGSFADIPVIELSGGQRQQVAIIMALMRQPDILLLDEFVANLDTAICTALLPWIHSWILSHSITTLMVTHDMELAKLWGNCVLELSKGKMVRFEKCHGKT